MSERPTASKKNETEPASQSFEISRTIREDEWNCGMAGGVSFDELYHQTFGERGDAWDVVFLDKQSEQSILTGNPSMDDLKEIISAHLNRTEEQDSADTEYGQTALDRLGYVVTFEDPANKKLKK